MTHCERVLDLLRDGREHSHLEGYRLGVMLHSRVADLRKKGHRIECWRDGDLYLYRLLDEAPLPDAGGVSSSGAGTERGKANSEHSPRPLLLTGATQPALLGSVQLIIGEVAA